MGKPTIRLITFWSMVKKRFSSSVNIAKTRSFPGADIGSDHELVMMTFKLHLKRTKKRGHARIRFDVDKLKDPHVVEVFQAMIGGKFAALSKLDSDMDLDTLNDTFNAAVTDTANEILGKHRPVKKPWVTIEILDLCDKRREMKKKKNKNDAEGTTEYRTVNRQIKKGMKKAKENWIGEQCENIEDSLKKNNSKRAYHLVKDLTSTKQERTTTIQDLFFFLAFAVYTIKAASEMNDVVFSSSCLQPYSLVVREVLAGHSSSLVASCRGHLCRTCSTVCSSRPQGQAGEGASFSLRCIWQPYRIRVELI